MVKTRSPRYPNISLEDAISKARMIYGNEHMSPMTPESAAEAMGYSGINGASLKTISSLRKYGILEGRGDDVRLSKDAQVLVLDDLDSSEYQTAYRNCALKPDIFADLHRQFGETGSERNISIYLEKQGFKPPAASTVAKHYKEAVGVISNGSEVEIEESNTTDVDNDDPVALTETLGTAATGKHEMPKRSNAPFVIVNDELHINDVVNLQNIDHFKRKLEIYENLLRLENDQFDDNNEF